jgi:hypothetical protein
MHKKGKKEEEVPYKKYKKLGRAEVMFIISYA